MAPRTRFFQAHREIDRFFQKSGLRAFTKQDLALILNENMGEWKLPLKYNNKKFCRDLIDFLDFEINTIDKHEVYAYKQADSLDLIQKIKRNSFYSHYTALRIHDLTEQTPYYVYLASARANDYYGDEVKQEAIDEAFRKEKKTLYTPLEFGIYKVFLKTIVCESIDIESRRINSAEYSYSLRVTNLEKTLIDAVINPFYCGGPSEVLKAFEKSKEKVSVIKIKNALKRLKYKYPYHQLIGFYMERAGFDEKKIKVIEDIGVRNDFYLIHGENKFYSERWRVHYPNAL